MVRFSILRKKDRSNVSSRPKSYRRGARCTGEIETKTFSQCAGWGEQLVVAGQGDARQRHERSSKCSDD